MPTARLPDINSSFLRHRGEFLDAARTGEAERALAAFHALNALLPSEVDGSGLPKHRVIISDRLYKEKHKHTLVAICPNCGAEHSRQDVRVLDVRQPPTTRLLSGRRSVRVWYCLPKSLLPAEMRKAQKPLEAAAAEAAERDMAREAAKVKAAKDAAAGEPPNGPNDPDGQAADPAEASDRPKAPKRQQAPAEEKPETCGSRNRLDRTTVQDRHHTEPYFCGIVPAPPKKPPGLAGRTPFTLAFQKWAGLAHAEFEGKSAEYRDAHWKRSEEDDGLGGAEMAGLFSGSLEDGAG